MRLSIARSRADAPAVIPADWRGLLARMPEHVQEAWEEAASRARPPSAAHSNA